MPKEQVEMIKLFNKMYKEKRESLKIELTKPKQEEVKDSTFEDEFVTVNRGDLSSKYLDDPEYCFSDQDIKSQKPVLLPPKEASLKPFYMMRLILATIKEGGFVTE